VTYDDFRAVRLVEPFKDNLRKKRDLMKEATQEFNRLMDYEFGEITAAATFYLAEIYYDFSQSLLTSERPKGLSSQEREEYELAIEDQAYPFEEKAIEVHESNLKLISRGVYNDWIEKSLQKLAKVVPARYDKPEEPSNIIGSPETYVFEISGPKPLVAQSEGPRQEEDSEPNLESEHGESAPAAPTGSFTGSITGEHEPQDEVAAGPERETGDEAPSMPEPSPQKPMKIDESGSNAKVESTEPERTDELLRSD
jgi:hypothetical protein